MYNQFYQASTTPESDLALITRKGQPPQMRIYRHGWENYLNQIPVMPADDDLLQEKIAYTRSVMLHLAAELRKQDWLRNEDVPNDGEFMRNILALERPTLNMSGESFDSHAEILIAKWGKGFESPVHGHNNGYKHEEILFGKVLVTNYRMVSEDSQVVRPVNMQIVEGATAFISRFGFRKETDHFARQRLIHNFRALEYSTTLHFLPEHTRDGIDNRFYPEYFSDIETRDVVPVTPEWVNLSARIGDVILVRSSNVPDFGDHYIVITGGLIEKPHGLRRQDEQIPAPNVSAILDTFADYSTNGAILLKLKGGAAHAFRTYHQIRIEHDQVIFPNY